MSYVVPLIVAAAGVLLLLTLVVRMFVVVRRFGIVSSTVKAIIGGESELVRQRVDAVSAEVARRRNRTAWPADTNTSMDEMLGTSQR